MKRFCSDMGKLSIVFALLLTLGQTICAQHEVQILNRSSGEPIPFVTVNSVLSSVGTVADEYGIVTFDSLSDDDSLQIRSIGYRQRVIGNRVFKRLDTLQISPRALELDEVIIRPIPPNEYVLLAMEDIDQNYRPDSFRTEHYYREWLRENNTYLRHTEAYLEALQPGYTVDRDSFIIGIKAGKTRSERELQFMQKEIEKDARKQQKKAKRKGEEFDEEDFEMPLELGNPMLMLLLDPIRHPSSPVEVNSENADFLDSTSHKDYNFWYGKPVPYGDRTLVVVHFDQRDKIRSSLFAGTLWIDQESLAFVKISFGFSEKGLKHLVPGYAEVFMWLYGLKYEVKETLIEFEYAPFKDDWVLASTRLKANLFLEKRRIFSENDLGDFVYECEMLTSDQKEETSPIQSVMFDNKIFLSEQVEQLDNNRWSQMKKQGRTIR